VQSEYLLMISSYVLGESNELPEPAKEQNESFHFTTQF
jgi:hypothetical protein